MFARSSLNFILMIGLLLAGLDFCSELTSTHWSTCGWSADVQDHLVKQTMMIKSYFKLTDWMGYLTVQTLNNISLPSWFVITGISLLIRKFSCEALHHLSFFYFYFWRKKNFNFQDCFPLCRTFNSMFGMILDCWQRYNNSSRKWSKELKKLSFAWAHSIVGRH